MWINRRGLRGIEEAILVILESLRAFTKRISFTFLGICAFILQARGVHFVPQLLHGSVTLFERRRFHTTSLSPGMPQDAPRLVSPLQTLIPWWYMSRCNKQHDNSLTRQNNVPRSHRWPLLSSSPPSRLFRSWSWCHRWLEHSEYHLKLSCKHESLSTVKK